MKIHYTQGPLITHFSFFSVLSHHPAKSWMERNGLNQHFKYF